jgi:hypothetical protein
LPITDTDTDTDTYSYSNAYSDPNANSIADTDHHIWHGHLLHEPDHGPSAKCDDEPDR